jgi:two-component system, OmpR family, phosphate regulon sensor histidine kinase PhoR
LKKQRSQLYYLVVFIFAQLALFSLLGLWIFRYVWKIDVDSGKQVLPQVMAERTDIIMLICGCILFAAIYLGMILIFRNLNIQLRVTKMYDNFIGNITHELKSPLASIQLFLETLDSRDVPRQKQKEFFTMMKRDTNRLTRLVDSVLEIAGLEQTKTGFESEIMDAEMAIRCIIEETRQQFSLPVDAVLVHGKIPYQFKVDLNGLKTVFSNLFDNAIKYSINETNIRVSLACDSRRMIIDFSDKGIGVSVKEQTKVFDKFHRIYDSSIPNVKGTGLGLYLVREIIRQHGGKITLSSYGKNTGATFRIRLPVYRESRRLAIGSMFPALKSSKLQKEEGHE